MQILIFLFYDYNSCSIIKIYYKLQNLIHITFVSKYVSLTLLLIIKKLCFHILYIEIWILKKI